MDDEEEGVTIAAQGPTPLELLLAGADALAVKECVDGAGAGAEAGDRAGVLPGPVALRARAASAASRSARSSRGCAAASSGCGRASISAGVTR